MRSFAAFLFITGCALAQSSFEVAELKVNRSGSRESSGDISNGRLVVTNATLRVLIAEAWSIPRADVEGPSWLDDVRLDLVAKAPSATTPDPEVRRMLQQLLMQRMKLVAHLEKRVQPVYALPVWKNNARMTRSTLPDRPEDSRCSFQNDGSQAHAHCQHMTMARLVSELAGFAGGYLDKPLVDQTDLPGAWELDLKWTPLARVEADGGLTLQAALQSQIGLQLENRKVPVPILVVESIAKAPVEN